ncbi:MAG: HAMP domain-containing histidine kinase [Oscillospiraceae bacterium]|jgi:signal transduction histidine kinase|nr:HAMP domain-containing histidine kinase [Oscillospiraceae bacterium]
MESNKALLEMFNVPAVIVRDGFISEANDPARELYFGSGDPVVVPLIGDRAEIDGVLYRLTSRLANGSSLYLLATKAPDSSIDNLLLGMSFKLREELGVSLAALAVLRKRLDMFESDEKTSRYVSVLTRSQMKLLRMADNLAEAFAADVDALDEYAVDLDELCGNLVNTVSHFLADKHRLIYENRLGDVNPYTAAEPRKLESMLLNLISNSVLHSDNEAGGTIRVVLTTNDAGFRINIKDDGAGFDNNMDSMFAIYSRDDTTRGTVGLGLAASLHIARLHGGSILAKSDKNETLISVFLPRRDISEARQDLANDILYDEGAMQRILAHMSEVIDSEHFPLYS